MGRTSRVLAALASLLLPVVTAACLRRPLAPLPTEGTLPALAPAAGAPVADGRARFREIYCAIREDHGRALPEDRPCEEVLLHLPGEAAPSGRPVALGPPRLPLRVVIVPGFLNECVIRWISPFADGRQHLEAHGYRTGLIRVSAMSSAAHNARQVRDAVMAMALEPGERLLVVGHSKGVVDTLEALVAHPEIVPRVAAVVGVAGAVGGTPIADGLRPFGRWLLRRLDVRSCQPGDGLGIANLRRPLRRAFLAGAALPASVRYFSVGGIVTAEETSWVLRPFQRRVAEIDPRNDSQVVAGDTLIPGGTLLGWIRGDHWALALPFSRALPGFAATHVDRNAFPREVLLEAIVRSVEEALAPSLTGRRR